MSRFISKRFEGMRPYVPGEQPQKRSYIKLNTNESPFKPSPRVIEAMSSGAAGELNLYPDPDAAKACAAIADYHGLSSDNVILGNGSDELLYFCFLAFCDESTPACYADITYGFYSVFARVLCLKSNVIPLDDGLEADVGAYCGAPGTKFIANPNAPTGQALALSEIERILKANTGNVVVVDEAYVDFGAKSALELIDSYDNLIVIRTMSKSRNLAGARLGYAMAQKPLIDDLNQMKFSFNPYNVNRLSLIAAEESIKDEAYFRDCVDAIINAREFTANELKKRGFEVLPSSANFIFVKPLGMSGGDYYRSLRDEGVLVRHFDAPRISGYVRVTIGSMEQMQAYLKATDDILAQI